LKKIILALVVVVLMSGLILVGCAEPSPSPSPAPSPAPSPSPSPAPAKPVLLRLAIPWPPGDPPQVEIQKYADAFNARSGGKATIEVHPAESLVKTEESLNAVRTGAVEMAGYPTGVFSSVDARLATPEIPFLYTSIRAEAAAQDDLLPMFNEFMPEKFNQMFMGHFICLPLELIGSKPVKTVADWKGLLVHSVSPVASQVIQAMGGSPVAQPFVEGYSMLEKKVVDASMISPQFSVTFKVYEVAKYETLGYLVPASLNVAINMDTYNSLPKDIQDLLVEEGWNFHKSANEFFIGAYTDANKFLADNGVEIYNLPKDERDKWYDLVWPISEKSLADMGDFGPRVVEVANKVNAEFPY
jgi:TRAP-type C4-dicarboxylate transport system substrate-binding protein